MISALSKIHFKKFSNLYKKLLYKLYFPKLALFMFPQVKTHFSISPKNFLFIETHLTVA